MVKKEGHGLGVVSKNDWNLTFTNYACRLTNDENELIGTQK